jgi:hypothetical protein
MSKQPEKKPKRSPRNGQPVPSNPNGRPKGSKNKFTTLKQSFLNVFERLGGDDALLKFAETHKAIFYQMVTRLFPTEVSGSLNLNTKLSIMDMRKSMKGITE